MSFEIDRHRYAELFGPTEGDSIRLGDTDLFIKRSVSPNVSLVAERLLEMVWVKMLHRLVKIQKLQI